jgi:hypothetical protein
LCGYPQCVDVVLGQSEWQARERAHQQRADSLSAEWRATRGTTQTHPVNDFLFTYYPYKPSLLRRWHPGAGVVLAGAAGAERSGWKWYRANGDDLIVDRDGMLEARGASIRFISSLLQRTAERPGNFGCFGLHEWAMVYKQDETRHDIALRLGGAATDTVVESHRIACSHIDAFRFFTAEAVPLNKLSPTRENQPLMEQPGCLHANMDVYKWTIKLGPLVPGELLLDAFELARDIRQLDMRASPYDLAEWGYEPVRIETTEGKAEYEMAQRGFADRANLLRERVLVSLRTL